MIVTFEHAENGGLQAVPAPPGPVDSWSNEVGTFVHRLNEIACRYPQRLALKSHQGSWNYRELNSAANRIAHVVLDALPCPCPAMEGCGAPAAQEPAERVVVFMGQGGVSIAALVAVLKAGKILVPVDPLDPAPRIERILADCRPALLLTDSASIDAARRFPVAGMAVHDVEADCRYLPDANPEISIRPDQLAYVLYTSGSTGAPKGVMHTHASLVADLRNRIRAQRLCVEDRVSLFGSATGQALKNTLEALASGASLFPVDARASGLPDLGPWVRGNRISVLTVFSRVFRTAVEGIRDIAAMSTVRILRLSGDHINSGDVALFRRHFSPQCVLLNILASTETGSLCAYALGQDAARDVDLVPVGYPFADARVVLVDDAGGPATAAETASIAVSGPALFSGYWGTPALGAARMVRDPADSERQLFRTSDVARRQKNGALVLLGRSDFQVKVRGFLVDMPEVEAALRAHTMIRDALVHPSEDEAGQRRLTAYIVPAGPRTPTVDELRGFLSPRLADHMIPAAFVELPSIPLMPNGKVDRRALPSPDRSRPRMSNAYRSPLSRIEAALQDIWSKSLKIDEVGVDDKFLDLGGDSLLAAQIVMRCREALGLNLQVRTIFEHPTIRALASCCNETTRHPDTNDLEIGLI